MKKINILFTISALMLFSACWDDENDNPPSKENKVEVKFNSSIAGQVTRAENNLWYSGDAIGIYMLNNNKIFAENKHYKTTGTGSFTPVNQEHVIYFPQNEQTVNFVSYYPYKASEENLVYKVDVSNQSNQWEIDLLYSDNAKDKTKDNNLVELNFHHKLSKVIFNIIPGEGITQSDLDKLEVQINGFETKANFNLETGTLLESTNPAIINVKTTTVGKTYEAIVLPIKAVTQTLVIFNLKNANGDSFTWLIPNGTKFEPEKKHTYNVTIKLTEVNVVGVIDDWIDGTGGNIIAD